MLRVRFNFQAGRFHATPHDHHRNEGFVEWPPHPWRILRALLATGFRHEGWHLPNGVPPEAHTLIESLAGQPPLYRWPVAPTLGHTRHYFERPQGPRLGLDAFALVRQGDALEIEWAVELEPPVLKLFDRLLKALVYLGRSTSWVKAERSLDPVRGGWEARPVTLPKTPPREGHMALDLLSPLSPQDFEVWRQELNDHAREDADRRARPSGPALRKLRKVVPRSLVEALCVDTETRRAARWSTWPGSRLVSYDVPLLGLPSDIPLSVQRGVDSDLALDLGDQPSERPAEDIDLSRILYTIGLSPHPPLNQVLAVAERFHRALAAQPELRSVDVRSRLLGLTPEDDPLIGHRHLHWLPVARGRRLVGLTGFLPASWTEMTLSLFARVVGMDQHPTPDHLLGPSRAWRTETPFILPRHPRRGRASAEQQVLEELRSRGFPEPASLEIWSSHRIRSMGFFSFRRARSRGPRPPQLGPVGLELRFDEPVMGPIALGYGAHFGLGCLRAV